LMKLYQPVLGVRFFWNTVYTNPTRAHHPTCNNRALVNRS